MFKAEAPRLGPDRPPYTQLTVPDHDIWISIDIAIGFLRDTATSSHAHIFDQAIAAFWWAHMASYYERPSVLDAFKAHLDISDRYVTLSRSLDTQHLNLVPLGSLPPAVAAAACAIEHKDLQLAVELVERGRGTLLSHLGRYRTPAIDDLRKIDPVLADRFIQLSTPLSISSTRDPRIRDGVHYSVTSSYEDNLAE